MSDIQKVQETLNTEGQLSAESSVAVAVEELPLKKKRRANEYERQKTVYGYFFLIPLLIGFVFIYGEILVNAIMFSLSKFDFTGTQYQLVWPWEEGGNASLWHNYHYIFFVQDGLIKDLGTSIGNMLLDIPVVIIFSLFIATIISGKVPGRTFFRAIFFIPAVLITGVIAESQLNNALLNDMNTMGGISTGGIASTSIFSLEDMEEILGDIVFSSSIFGFLQNLVENIFDVVNKCGVQILIFISALLGINPSIYESAKIEGANGWDCYWKITVPMLVPMIYVNIIYTIVDSLCATDNVVMQLMDSFRSSADYDLASATAVTYFIIIGLIIGLISLVMRRFMSKD